MLLEAGADPLYTGQTRETPMDIAMASAASDVIEVLRRHGEKRKDVAISGLEIMGGSDLSVRGTYVAREASQIPEGFAKTCREEGWNPIATWNRLGHSTWFEKKNQDVTDDVSTLALSRATARLPLHDQGSASPTGVLGHFMKALRRVAAVFHSIPVAPPVCCYNGIRPLRPA